MVAHKTDRFQDSDPITPGTTSDCFVNGAKDDDDCILPMSEIKMLQSYLIVRRGGPQFTLDIPADSQLFYAASKPGVPTDVDHTIERLSSTGMLTFKCTDPIGEYHVKSSGTTIQQIIVLFNPYAPECDEYLDGLNGEEYIESENGLIWQGLSDNHEAHVWNFDQYNGLNLIVALHLTRRLPLGHRSSPISVSRGLSFSVNEDMCYGKWGEGKYETGHEGDYKCTDIEKMKKDNSFDHHWPSKCTDPSHWKSTTELTEQYWARHTLQKKHTNVQFCQCFVYSGIMTTFGRSIGIATRPVTTFQSAHDTNNDKAISKFYWLNEKENDSWDPLDMDDLCTSKALIKKCKDKKTCNSDGCKRSIELGENAEGTKCGGEDCSACITCNSNSDSIWSFHVWNDMWMKRPDLTSTHGISPNGWQAVDATPQELSDDVNQMGPSSVNFISHSVDERCYDGQFVMSEVNADIKLYLLKGSSSGDATNNVQFVDTKGKKYYYDGMKYIDDPFDDKYNTVGCLIATKKPGSISETCKKNSAKCSKEKDDITWRTKKKNHALHGGYKIKKRQPGTPNDDVDTSTCLFGSKGDTAAMDIERFQSTKTRMLRKQDNSKKRKRDDDIDINEEDDENDIHAPSSKRQKPDYLEIDYNEEMNRKSVIVGHDHTLSIMLRNNNPTKPLTVKVSFSGIGLDYRGIPLIRQELRNGKKIPWRIIMKGRQTIHRITETIESKEEKVITLIVPSTSLKVGIHGGSNKFIKWSVITKLVDDDDDTSSSSNLRLPSLHEFSAKLIQDNDLQEMDVDEEDL